MRKDLSKHSGLSGNGKEFLGANYKIKKPAARVNFTRKVIRRLTLFYPLRLNDKPPAKQPIDIFQTLATKPQNQQKTNTPPFTSQSLIPKRR